MHEKHQHQTGSLPLDNGRQEAGRNRALRRGVKRLADMVMRCENAPAAANESLAALRAELLWRFELLRSRQRQPDLLDPEPLPSVAPEPPEASPA